MPGYDWTDAWGSWEEDDDSWEEDDDIFEYPQDFCPECYSQDLTDVPLDDGLLSVTCFDCSHVWYEIDYYDESWLDPITETVSITKETEWDKQRALVDQENKIIASKDITIGKSELHGHGIFATKDLPAGYDLGTLSLIFNNWFLDTSYGRYINHSYQPNVELYHVQADDHIKVGGKLRYGVAAGTELTANYADPLAPKPNFIAPA